MNSKVIIFLMCVIRSFSALHSAYVAKDGKFINAKYVAYVSDKDHFQTGLDMLDEGDWREALRQFHIVMYNFPSSPLCLKCCYHMGVGYFHKGDYDFARKYFSRFITSSGGRSHLSEDAWGYLFAIGEAYASGARKHLFGFEGAPMWVFVSKTEALDIFDDIISSLAGHPLAVQSLYAKGKLLVKRKEYSDAVEAFTTLIRRYPKHDFAPESYYAIGEVYCEQSKSQVNNVGLLELANKNVERFREHFPREERIEEMEEMICSMREVYAQGIYESGMFYEKIKKPKAAVLYYLTTTEEFPDTQVAAQCRRKVQELQSEVESLGIVLGL